MAFPEGDTFVILPNLCKRNSPLENMYLPVIGDLKLMGVHVIGSFGVLFYGRKIIKEEKWIRLCLNKGEAKKYVKTILCKV
jgi:hypothetical protein